MKEVCVGRGGNRILNGVSIDVPAGGFFVLMGPTGCGKTTLLRIAGLLDKPDSGEILFNEEPVPCRGRELMKIRRRIASVLQTPVMFRGTVKSNILWGLRTRGITGRKAVMQVSRVLELTDLKDISERAAFTLSGGEKRRTALARALALEPELLVLDEPTSSLDPSFKSDLLHQLKHIHEVSGATILMATHDFTDALAAGTAGAAMRKGVIEQFGSMDDILFRPQSHFMALFTGVRNIFPAEFKGNYATVSNLTISHPGNRTGHGFLAVPPEVIVLSHVSNTTSERNRFRGVVNAVERAGTNWDVAVEVDDIQLIAAITTGALNELSIFPGSEVYLSFKASAVHLF
jgi:molybdopterin-binding protein